MTINRLAIIPARLGSKRIYRKNVRLFCGKPMISYPVFSLMQTGIFQKIHVSTESEEIQELVRKECNLEIDFLRSGNLSDDATPLRPVIDFVVRKYKDDYKLIFDEVWLVLPCNPFLTAEIIMGAAKISLGYNDCLVSVSEYPVPVEWAFRLSEFEDQMIPLNPENLNERSQDIERKYFDNGLLAKFSAGLFYSDRELSVRYRGMVFPKHAGVDIDDEDDWLFAENLYKAKRLI